MQKSKKFYEAKTKSLKINGLYMYLKLNNNTTDSSSSLKQTYIQGAFTYQNGLYDGIASNCVLFNSSGQIITCGTPPQFSFGNGEIDSDFSLGLIIKPSSNGSRRTLMAKGDFYTPSAREYLLELQSNNTLRFQIYDQSATAYKQITTTATFTSGNIYNIDAVYSDGALFLYSNGSPLSVTASSSGTYVAMEALGTRLQLGKHLSFNAYPFGGNMDEVTIWSRSLSADEIINKHNKYVSGIALK